MLNTDPQEQFEELKKQLLDQVQSTFPIQDSKGRFEVRVKDLVVHDDKGVDDIRGQLQARLKGDTWAVPVRGTVEVVDAKGKVLVTKPNTRIAEIPKLTRHYSYIVDGREKMIANQWRLKPGAYVKETGKEGQYEAQFQLAKGKSFDIQMDQDSGYMFMAMGARKIPLYSVLNASGISDDQMRKVWGDRNFEANRKKAKPEKDLLSFHVASGKGKLEAGVDSKEELHRYFAGTEMDPSVTKDTLGKGFAQVDQHALFLASKKLLDVSSGKMTPDPIDALQYKELWSAKDHFSDRLNAATNEIHSRVRKSLNKPTVQKALMAGDPGAIRNVVMPDLIQKSLMHVFGMANLANNSNQINPLSMLSDKSHVTIMGPGGLRNEHMVSQQNTSLDPSQLGFVDPVFTPESAPGTSLHLAAGTTIKNRKPQTTLYNLRTKKVERVSPDVAARATVVFPDQIRWNKGIPVPRSKMVRVSDNKGVIRDVLFKDADYTLVDSSQVFAIETNLVPFMQNDSAGRTTMSARHMGQAISVVGREAPLVQVQSSPGHTFEGEVANRFLAHKAPVAGKVLTVHPDHIIIQGNDKKKHAIDIYDHYPLNDPKAMLHSTALVRPGDKVSEGQILADNNFTRGGKLALGTNLRTAYISNGTNHEDGIVISESAAKKLGSAHLYKPSLLATSETIIGRTKFQAHKPNAFTKDQLKGIGDEGVVKPGTIVHPGDPLVLALNPETNPDSIDMKIMARLSKKTRLDFKNNSLTWDHEHSGEVVRVAKNGKDWVVHVKTHEPATVGSKISTRHSAKGIVSEILPDAEMPHDRSKRPVDMMISPVAIMGRMNPGQILETVAGKIAEKTGKPYEVKNFDGGKDYLAGLKKELKEHGLSETETLFDPKTGRKLGEVTVGPHYAFQLVHQIDKKTHTRHGGFYVKGLSPHIQYDQNKVPRGGGEGGAQSLGALGIYGALTSNLKDNLREMQTWKCFTWKTRILTEQGPIPIGKIVNQKMDVKVLSWDFEKDRLVYSKIVNHWKRYRGEDELIELVVRCRVSEASPYKRSYIRCTPNHRVFTSDGRKIEAGNAAGEELLVPAFEMHENQKALLVGSLLGDGHMAIHNGCYPHFQERHCDRQKDYLLLKAEVLAEFETVNSWHTYNAGYKGFNVGQTMHQWGSLASPGFANLHKVFYPDGKKVVPDALDDLLSPLAVAIWYQDDGSLVKATRARVLCIHIGCVSNDDASKLCIALSKVSGVPFKVISNPGEYHGYVSDLKVLRLGRREDIERFLNYVRPYVHPCLSYKVGGGRCGWALDEVRNSRSARTVMPSRVIEVRPSNATQFDGPCLYDLGVAGTHSYFAEGVLVSNSDQSQAEGVWDAIKDGQLLPPPTVPFVYKKFEAQMKAIGLNLEKQGNHLRLIPNTDAEIKALSRGEVTRPDMAVIAKNVKPEKGGIFDTRIFGGQNGRHWGHIKLVESMPNPVFAKPIAQLVGIKPEEMEQVIAGKKTLPKFGTGAQAIRKALGAIDVNKELARTASQLRDPKLKSTALNQANSLHKTLRMLKETKQKPADAFLLQNLPVMPPIYRPFTASPDKTDRIDPMNNLYRRLGQVNVSLRESDKAGVPYELTLRNRADLYKEMQNLFGTTSKGKKAFDINIRGKEIKDHTLPGVLHMISGNSPKDGFFQAKMIGKKQDYTARATIVADPSLSPDEVGVPRKIAIEMYRPFVTKHLVQTGLTPLQAQQHIQKRSTRALTALDKVIENHPVLLKRDPVLHAYGLVGQRVKLTNSPAIKVSPLILDPIGGDIDGDTVALMLPLSEGSKEEVRRIMPSQRPLSDSTGDVLYKPTNESMLGLYRSTLSRKITSQKFLTLKDAEAAFKQNKVDLSDVVTIGGAKTTLGRARISAIVPDKFKQQILTDLKKPFGKGEMHEVLKYTAQQKPKHFAETAARLSRLGFQMAYESGHSLTLNDLEPLRDKRQQLVSQAKKEVDALKGPQASQQATRIYMDATKKMHAAYNAHYEKNPNNISDMLKGKIKAKLPQFQGSVMAPMLVEDYRGRPAAVPIIKSFAEGIGVGDYWLQAQGARRGVIQKVDEVSEPGAWTKMMVQVNIDQPVTSEDCKTTQGIMMPLTNRDVVDRHLASPVKVGGRMLPAGTPVTPDIQRALAKAKVKSVAVRSPLKCRMPQGVCSMCMGRHPDGQHYKPGENVGLAAAQALGERAAQIMLRQTHAGGIVTADRQIADTFNNVRDLFSMQKKKDPNQASLAGRAGKVTRVEQPRQGGWAIHTSTSKKALYSRQRPLPQVQVGYQFQKGEKLTQGDPNMHDLLKTKGFEAVQDHMVRRVGGIYDGEGIMQRHVELAVRNATNMVRVDDPGSHPSILRGDYMQKTVVDEINRNVLKGQAGIQSSVVLKNISEIPGYRQRDWMGQLMTKNLGAVITTAAAHGGKSRVHGVHPIPGLAYAKDFGKGPGPTKY